MKKKVFFQEDEDQHARMLIRLRYDKLTQGNFFRGLVKMYVSNDLDMVRVIEKIKAEKTTMGRNKRSKTVEEVKKGENMMDSLGLSKDEKNFIYDLIEEDFEE